MITLVSLSSLKLKDQCGFKESFSFSKFEETGKPDKYSICKEGEGTLYSGNDKDLANDMFRAIVNNARKENKKYRYLKIL